MRVIEKTIFEFSELSDSAKQTARDNYRVSNNDDNYFYESVIEDAADIAEIMGIDLRQKPVKLMNGSTRYDPEIYFSGFSSQGDGAQFKGSYKYKKGALKLLKQHAPIDNELHRICKGLQDTQKRVFYSASCSITTSGRYSHSGSMQFSFDMLDSIGPVVFNETEELLTELLRDFADWVYKQLETEYDFFNSDAQIEESIDANEYEFDENGDIA